jgi:hypothetical protein
MLSLERPTQQSVSPDTCREMLLLRIPPQHDPKILPHTSEIPMAVSRQAGGPSQGGLRAATMSTGSYRQRQGRGAC